MKRERRLYWDIPDNAYDDDLRCPYRYRNSRYDDDEEEETEEEEEDEENENE